MRQLVLFVALSTILIPIVADLPSAGPVAAGEVGPLSPFGVVDPDSTHLAAQVGAYWLRWTGTVYRFLASDSATWQGNWDDFFDDTEAYGMQYSPDIRIGKCWMSGFTTTAARPSYPPTDLSTTWNPTYGYSQLYYDFITLLVQHYLGRMVALSIEGEANSNWAGTADEYVRTLATASKAAHDVDPDIMVLDSGIGSGAFGAVVSRYKIDSGLYTDQEILDFANDYYDRSVFFPLFFSTIGALQTWLSSAFVADQINRVNYMLDHMGNTIDGFNFKYTEYWWLYQDVIDYIDMRTGAAGYHYDIKVNNEASVWVGAAPETYAKELVQQYAESARLGVARNFWFPLSNAIDPDERVGLFDESWVLQPVGDAHTAAARIISDRFQFDYLDLSEPDVRQYIYAHRSDPEHHLRICWWDDGDHGTGSSLVRFDLPPGTRRVIKTDYVGNRAVADVIGQSYIDITVSEIPIYLEYIQDRSLVTSVPGEAGSTLSRALLEQNYPNPFNPATTIRYQIPGAVGETQAVRLTIYDTRGRAVRHLVDGVQTAGTYSERWGGEDDRGEVLPGGIYLTQLDVGSHSESRKMILNR